MNDTFQTVKTFVSTPFGLTVLVVGIVIILLLLIPLKRSLTYLVKGVLWGLLILLVLGVAAAGVWLYMESRNPDPERRAAMRREATDFVSKGISTNLGTWLKPQETPSNDE